MMKVGRYSKYGWLLSLIFLFAGSTCKEDVALNIPSYFKEKTIWVNVFYCDYAKPPPVPADTLTACQSNPVIQGKSPQGRIKVHFTSDSFRITLDDSVKKIPLLGETFASLEGDMTHLIESGRVTLLAGKKANVKEYDEVELDDRTYGVVLYLKEESLHYALRLVFSTNQDGGGHSGMSMEMSLDVSNPSDPKLLSDSTDYPRSSLESVNFLGVGFK